MGIRLLLEHRSGANLGDSAMIEGAVHRLSEILPQWEIHVPDRPGLRTTLWQYPMVRQQIDYTVRPRSGDLSRIHFLWRYNHYWRKIVHKATVLSLGNVLAAGPLLVYDGLKRDRSYGNLKSFCEEFDALHLVGQSGLVEVFSDCLFQQCCLILAFAEQGKPVILTGQQLGPLPRWLYRNLVFRTLKQVRFVGLREPSDSVTMCQEARLRPEGFEVMGDDSFGMNCASDEQILALLDQHGLVENGFLAVNVRVARYAGEHRRHLKKIARLLEELAQEFSMPILNVPISFNRGGSDVDTGRELRKIMGNGNLRVIEGDHLTAPLVKGLLGKAWSAVGISYHFCTFALSQGVPAVCLYDGAYYAQKARGLCGFWGDSRLAINLSEVNNDFAVYQIVEVANDEALRRKLEGLSRQVVAQWEAIFDLRVREALEAIVR